MVDFEKGRPILLEDSEGKHIRTFMWFPLSFDERLIELRAMPDGTVEWGYV